MKILALEFSAEIRSAAVANFEAGETRVLACISEGARNGRSAMDLVARALRSADVPAHAISRLAIALGPGSYAGIRAAIAIAQGWALARPVEVTARGSIESLCEEAQALGLEGEIAFAVDAQREEVYLSTYALKGGKAVQKERLRLAPVGELARFDLLAGPEASRWKSNGRNLRPSAEWLARSAPGLRPVAAESLEPIYLRETAFLKATPPRSFSEG